ncbi:MAG: hypothetical protein SPF04_05375 [Bacilli bacterium]|nr:hypothetical protein [Bacilli bacterium]MDY5058877.1 hypothetical protein [Bacilli bacterium]
MKEKNKSRRIKVILFACIVVIGIAVFLVISNNKNSTLVSNTNKVDKNIIELVDDKNDIDEEIFVEDKGEESTTEEIKTEVSNTPKSEEKKKVVNNQTKSNTSSKTNKQESTINQEQPIQQPTTTPKQEEVVNSSNQDNSSNNETPKVEQETPKENTDLYNSITHGKWETDINDSSSLCEAKGVRIANNELNAILDWNELHEEEQKQPIINYSRCYPVIRDGIKHWYLHFFTTKGEGMDTELKNKYN